CWPFAHDAARLQYHRRALPCVRNVGEYAGIFEGHLATSAPAIHAPAQSSANGVLKRLRIVLPDPVIDQNGHPQLRPQPVAQPFQRAQARIWLRRTCIPKMLLAPIAYESDVDRVDCRVASVAASESRDELF